MNPFPPSFLAGLWTCLLVSLAAGCRGASTVRAEPLPFHVALMPTDLSVAEDDQGGEFLLTEKEVSDALAAALQRDGFVRVTPLRLPDGAAAELEQMQPEELERYWQERARETQADVLLRATLSYRPQIEGGINDRFWLNLPLFALGGPLCWFVNDRSYELPARLQADLFDVTEIHEDLERDWELLPLPIYVEFDRATLDFLDRADSGGHYLLSLLIPAGLVAGDSDKVPDRVRAEFLDVLGSELARKVQLERRRIEHNRNLWAFRLETSRSLVRRNADGTATVEVPVRAGEADSPLFGYELRSGAELRTASFDAPDAEGLCWVREVLPVDPQERFVRLRIDDSQGRARSYTLPIDASGAAPAGASRGTH